jgi:peptidoglycan-associated lipoprotein
MNPTIRKLSLLGLGALAALACASSKTVTESTPAKSTKPQQEVAIQPAAAPALDPVYFDTDEYKLRPDAREALKARAKLLAQHPEWGIVTIQGHCDERGSEEYNLALGERRAAAVKRYLVDLGVPASRLATVTFGENRPAVFGHDESSWRLNRRSELAREALQSAAR